MSDPDRPGDSEKVEIHSNDDSSMISDLIGDVVMGVVNETKETDEKNEESSAFSTENATENEADSGNYQDAIADIMGGIFSELKKVDGGEENEYINKEAEEEEKEEKQLQRQEQHEEEEQEQIEQQHQQEHDQEREGLDLSADLSKAISSMVAETVEAVKAGEDNDIDDDISDENEGEENLKEVSSEPGYSEKHTNKKAITNEEQQEQQEHEEPHATEDGKSTDFLISGAVDEIMKHVSSTFGDSVAGLENTEPREENSAAKEAELAISNIVGNVVSSLPKSDDINEKSHEDNIDDDSNDFQSAMKEMIQNVADEIVTDDQSQSGNDLQFAIEEMVKNVVDENYEDASSSQTASAAKTSFIDTLLSKGDLASTIIANTLSQRRQQLGTDKFYKKSSDLAEELLKSRDTIASKDFSNAPLLRELINKHALQNVASGISSVLPLRQSFYSGVYATTEGPDPNVKPSASANYVPKKMTSFQTNTHSSLTQVINLVVQNILGNNKLANALKIDHKEKIRLNNRTRKQKWREKNNTRNKDNDLRARLLKKAASLFGPEDSEKKSSWIVMEFERRKMRRIERLKTTSREDSVLYSNSKTKRDMTAKSITSGLINGSEKGSNVFGLLPADLCDELNGAISSALETSKIDIPQDQLVSSITQYLSSFFNLNPGYVHGSKDGFKDATKMSSSSSFAVAASLSDSSSRFSDSPIELGESAEAPALANDLSNVLASTVKRKLEEAEKKPVKFSKQVPSFRLPVYKKTLGPTLARGKEVSGIKSQAPATRKKPSLLSALDMQSMSRPIVNSNGIKGGLERPKLSLGSFRRPLYKSAG